MHKTTEKIEQVRQEDGRFPVCAWPGGYPVTYLTEDGSHLCPACVNGENGSGVGSDDAVYDDGTTDPQWTVVGHGCHWEGPPIVCEHCGAEVESAYGDPDAMKIKLDNLDRSDGLVLITCADRDAAHDDQSIAGANWECPEDMNVAYAMPVDHIGLVDELITAGYDVDTADYCAPEPT